MDIEKLKEIIEQLNLINEEHYKFNNKEFCFFCKTKDFDKNNKLVLHKKNCVCLKIKNIYEINKNGN